MYRLLPQVKQINKIKYLVSEWHICCLIKVKYFLLRQQLNDVNDILQLQCMLLNITHTWKQLGPQRCRGRFYFTVKIKTIFFNTAILQTSMEAVPEGNRRPCSENDFKPALFVCLCTLAYHKPLSSTMFKAHTYACRVIFQNGY